MEERGEAKDKLGTAGSAQPKKTPKWGEIRTAMDETKTVLQGTAQCQLTHCPPQQQL